MAIPLGSQHASVRVPPPPPPTLSRSWGLRLRRLAAARVYPAPAVGAGFTATSTALFERGVSCRVCTRSWSGGPVAGHALLRAGVNDARLERSSGWAPAGQQPADEAWEARKDDHTPSPTGSSGHWIKSCCACGRAGLTPLADGSRTGGRGLQSARRPRGENIRRGNRAASCASIQPGRQGGKRPVHRRDYVRGTTRFGIEKGRFPGRTRWGRLRIEKRRTRACNGKGRGALLVTKIAPRGEDARQLSSGSRFAGRAPSAPLLLSRRTVRRKSEGQFAPRRYGGGSAGQSGDRREALFHRTSRRTRC